MLPKGAYLDRLPLAICRKDLPLLPLESRLRKGRGGLFLIYLWRIIWGWCGIKKIGVCNRDAIICASHLFHDTFPLLLQRRTAFECVFTYHLIRLTSSRQGIGKWISRFLESRSLGLISSRVMGIITSSELVKKQLEAILQMPPKNFFVTKNGVDTDLIKEVLDQKKDIDVIFCGRFVKHKGVGDLLEALRLIDSDSMVVYLVGNGPELPAIVEKITRLNLRNIYVETEADDHQKFTLLKRAKLFVLPSYEEGWGIVIGEALACGVPVISYSIEEIKMIWGAAVRWVSLGDVRGLAKAIQESRLDLASSLETAVQWRQCLDWKDILDQEIDFIDQGISLRS